jgi:hypothetical protein
MSLGTLGTAVTKLFQVFHPFSGQLLPVQLVEGDGELTDWGCEGRQDQA